MVDYLALVGDTTDNIPGVKGVGDKTASQLLQRWGFARRDLRPHRRDISRLGAKEADRRQAERLSLARVGLPEARCRDT